MLKLARCMILGFFLAAASAGAADHAVGHPAPPKVGDLAPTLTLTDLDGKVHVLQEEAATGPVVLVFFRGVW